MNDPLLDVGIVEIEPDSAEEANWRKRLIAQANRRVKRTEEDQTLIAALSNQVEVERNRADATANELANNHQAAREVWKAQEEFQNSESDL